MTVDKTAEALQTINETLQALEDAGWTDDTPFPNTRAGGSAETLYYERAFLEWHVAREPYDNSYVRLLDGVNEHGATEVEQAGFESIPDHLKRGAVAVISAGRTLEGVLEKLPGTIVRSQTLLDGPDAHVRQVDMKADDDARS